MSWDKVKRNKILIVTAILASWILIDNSVEAIKCFECFTSPILPYGCVNYTNNNVYDAIDCRLSSFVKDAEKYNVFGCVHHIDIIDSTNFDNFTVLYRHCIGMTDNKFNYCTAHRERARISKIKVKFCSYCFGNFCNDAPQSIDRSLPLMTLCFALLLYFNHFIFLM